MMIIFGILHWKTYIVVLVVNSNTFSEYSLNIFLIMFID